MSICHCWGISCSHPSDSPIFNQWPRFLGVVGLIQYDFWTTRTAGIGIFEFSRHLFWMIILPGLFLVLMSFWANSSRDQPRREPFGTGRGLRVALAGKIPTSGIGSQNCGTLPGTGAELCAFCAF